MLLFRPVPLHWSWGAALCALPLWGMVQLVAGGTEDRFATLQSVIQFSALSATALVSYSVARSGRRLDPILVALAWFGFLVSIAGVLTYYTSPGQIFWLIEARYPDLWGPFLSRNNFAQFLELTLPVAFWLAYHRSGSILYWAMAATILAAGLVSASRAGAILLALESLAVFLLAPRRDHRRAVGFAIVVLLLASAGGAVTLLGRFASDPLAMRSQIYQSAWAMIAARPWQGYGLGTFALVYPEFALFDSGYRIEHAHNDWLEWAAGGGMAFPAVWGVLFTPAMAKVRTHFWALGMAAVLLHALADFPMARLGIAGWVFFLLGLLESSPRPQLRRST